MKRKNLTAAIIAFAMAATCLTTGTGLVSAADESGTAYLLGDTSGDGLIDAKDSSEILAEYSRLSTGAEGFFADSRAEAADVNGNGKIDSSDASDVLMYYAYCSTGGELGLPSFIDSLKQKETGTTTATSAETTTAADTATTTAVTTTSAPDPNKVTELLVSRSELTMNIGEGELSARVTMHPETATDLREVWFSSDENVVTVDTEGWITAVSAGTATITVQSVNNPEARAEIKVTVAAETTTAVDMRKVTSIRLSRTEVTMEAGTAELSARVTMLPATATDLREIWTSSDESVVTVDGEGWITAKSAGTATITVQSVNNPEVTATITVTVTDGTNTAPATTSAELTTTSTETTTTAATEDTTTSADTTTAATEETSSASTTEQTTTSAVTTAEETTSTSTTADPDRVAAIELSVTSIELSVGERGISYVHMLPETAKNVKEIWTSSDPKVATVDGIGNITAVGAGSCVITVRSDDNRDVSADIDVKVFPAGKVRKIELSATELTIELGEKKISYVKMLPENDHTKNEDELWVCSDTNIATVDEYGWVTGKSIGECTVTVYSVDNPDVKAEIKVTVVSPDEPETPVDTPPESKIVPDSSDEERIAFRTPFPEKAKGNFSIEYVITYGDDTQSNNRTSVITVPTLKDYTVYFKTDKGNFSVTSYLYNEDNSKRARIGTYEFKTSPVGCTTTVEDIIYAFYYVGGLTE